MLRIIKKHKWSTSFLVTLGILAVLVVGCGAGTTTAGTGSTNSAAPVMGAHVPSGQQSGSTSAGGPSRYLIKTLNINMEVPDTQQAASDLQAWISTTDPLSTADNINYDQVGNNLYNVSMTFSVQAALYPRIESYLNAYPTQHHGRLLNTSKTTQDVTGDYVDTQSRLKNLRAEQSRLLTLLGHAQALSDILSIDQRLTDVEGQIEQIEAHLKDLDSQTSFYKIAVSLQPSQALLNAPPTAWSPIAVWQSALAASLAFAQVLVTVLIWLAVFSMYIVPAALIVWFVRRWRRMQRGHAVPPIAGSVPPQVGS